MAKEMLNIECTLEDILKSNGGELRTLADKAIRDMVDDTISRFKDQGVARKVTIEIGLVRMDDQIWASYKVTPKAAPYSRVPTQEDSAATVPGQMTIYDADDAIDADVIPPDHQIGCSAEE